MTEVRRRLLLNALKVLDLALVTASFGFAVLVLYAGRGPSLEYFLSIRVKLWNVLIFSALIFVWHIVFSLCGMYKSKRLSTRRREVFDILISTTLCSFCVAALSLSASLVTPRFVVVFWLFSSVLNTTGRLILRYVLGRIRRRGRNLRYLLILGTNRRAIEFAQSVEARPELGYTVLGFVDEDWHGSADFKKTGHNMACDFASLPEFVRRNVVDEVANYLPLRSFYEHASEVAALCELHGMTLRFNTDIFGLRRAHSQYGELDGNYYITNYPGIRDGLPLVMKRGLDILGSATLLVLLSPLLVLVALLVKLTSKGPIFFLQERVGWNKRRFHIFKFRTMVPGAEGMMAKLEALNEVSGPVFKIKNDPRITTLGKFLRRTSVDEVPQLLNVLKGDMSLVGPRPLPVRDYQGFSEDWQRRRFSMRPGITCLWQVNGRSSITFEQWMRLDLQYMDQWSFWLDVKILVRTIPAVLKGSGAV
jgi:exopolysaccharide biosynthesis polyprenyl glycosylphosphotransferase